MINLSTHTKRKDPVLSVDVRRLFREGHYNSN